MTTVEISAMNEFSCLSSASLLQPHQMVSSHADFQLSVRFVWLSEVQAPECLPCVQRVVPCNPCSPLATFHMVCQSPHMRCAAVLVCSASIDVMLSSCTVTSEPFCGRRQTHDQWAGCSDQASALEIPDAYHEGGWLRQASPTVP